MVSSQYRVDSTETLKHNAARNVNDVVSLVMVHLREISNIPIDTCDVRVFNHVTEPNGSRHLEVFR